MAVPADGVRQRHDPGRCPARADVAIHPDYLDDNDAQATGEVNFADRGLQLSRGFRALKVWVSLQTFGLAVFRAAIQRGLDLAELGESLVRGHPELTLMAPAVLGIVCFRREWPGCDEAETERRGLALAAALEQSGAALVSSTRLAGQHAIRLCVLNPTSSDTDVRGVIEHFATASAPAAPGHGAAPADPRAAVLVALDRDPLRAVPLLARARGATLRAVRARATRLGTAAGDEIIRRWDADRSFCIIESGQFDVLIDGHRIRTLGPGDHFGELAARDWGGGYGYTRLATVVSTGPGELLRLTSDDLRWLMDAEPTARAAIARDLAERLRER